MKRALLSFLLIAFASSCTTETPVTEIVVVVDTDISVPGGIDTVQISVDGLGASTQTASASLSGASDLPVTSTLVHRGGPLGPITVTAEGRFGSTSVVSRTARLSFISDRSSVLEMHLVDACRGQSCAGDQTCSVGGCRPVEVLPGELGTWDGTPPRLEGVDAGPMDTGVDTGVDSGMDTGVDTGTDSGMDTGVDSGGDTGMDTGVDAGPPDRVTAGLVVLYEFDEGTGDTVADTSGVGSPMNLTIDDIGAVTWSAGALSIDANTVVTSGGPAMKVFDALTATNEFTVEAWVTPLDDTQFGPARLISLSPDPFERNFLLGQAAATWAVRLRTALTDADGNPEWTAGFGSARPSLSHIVMTHTTASGGTRVWVDGVTVGTNTRGGDFSSWDNAYPLNLANEGTIDRTWLGVLHLVAIYDRPLPGAEVRQNFMAGSGDP